MSDSNGITEADDGTLTWLTDHGDKVTVFKEKAKRGDRHEWRWHVQARGNNEVVGGNESHPQRAAAKSAAMRHHPPTAQPSDVETKDADRAPDAEAGSPATSDRVAAVMRAMQSTREFPAGTAFGVPTGDRESFTLALTEAAVAALDSMVSEPSWEEERAELVHLSRKHELDNHHNAALCPYCSPRGDAIDVVHLARQAAWSERTFGPGTREKGVIQHIRKELIEIEDATTPERKQKEWIDVVILGLDGARRAGLTPQQIVAAVQAKQTLNEGRVWPDWRTMSEDVAIERDRTAGGDDA